MAWVAQLGLALMVLTASAASFAQSVPMVKNSYGLYTVDVNVGRTVLFSGDPDAEPVPFIIDTGASHAAVPHIIAQQLISQDQISLDMIGHGTTGPFNTDLIFIDQMDFGLGVREVEVAVFEEAYGSVMSAAGLLGSNVFRSETIRIDFPGRRLHRLSQRLMQGSEDLRLEGGLILGTARLRGVETPVQVILDTGATASLANTALARARGGRVRMNENLVFGVSGAEAHGEARKLLSRFQLDQFCISLFEITVSDVYAFDHQGWSDQPAIILGMDVLNNAVITIDYQTGAVTIEGIDNRSCSTSRANYTLTIQRSTSH